MQKAITDTHCHLASSQFSEDLEEVVRRSEEAGVRRMVTIGTDLLDSRKCVEIAHEFSGVHATVGVHPCSVFDVQDEDWLSQLCQLANDPRVVALGEMGLDYFHPPPDGISVEDYRAHQKDFFRKQLELAAETNLNVVVHQRDRGDQCWSDLLEIVAPFAGRVRAVFHCFSHPWEEAAKVTGDGHLISFTGIATFKNARVVQECVKMASPGAFMLETDAPYLAPEPHRGRRCEPAFAADTFGGIAKIRGESEDTLARHIEETVDSFFRFHR
ncbi:MAG: TatD family hydrolase [Verrucomicrobiota bacterium]